MSGRQAEQEHEQLPRAARRIVLRRLNASDLPQFQAYRLDPLLGLYQGWTAQSDAEALRFLNEVATAPLFQPGEWIQLGIEQRDTGVLIGDIGVCVSAAQDEAEIGFTLRAPSQRSGLATEAVRTALALVFEHTPVARVVGITDARNLASIRLLERVGMRRLKTLSAVFRGEPCVEHEFAISRHDAVALV